MLHASLGSFLDDLSPHQGLLDKEQSGLKWPSCMQIRHAYISIRF